MQNQVQITLYSSGSQSMGHDPTLGRGEHPDGLRIFYKNNFIFCILDES
jgi:hypothetical protein